MKLEMIGGDPQSLIKAVELFSLRINVAQKRTINLEIHSRTILRSSTPTPASESERIIASLLLAPERFLHLLCFCLLLFCGTAFLVTKADGHLVAKCLASF